MRVYLAYTRGAPAPQQLLDWDLAERYGWTLDYIDSLPMARIHEWLQIEDGKMKAKNSILKR